MVHWPVYTSTQARQYNLLRIFSSLSSGSLYIVNTKSNFYKLTVHRRHYIACSPYVYDTIAYPLLKPRKYMPLYPQQNIHAYHYSSIHLLPFSYIYSISRSSFLTLHWPLWATVFPLSYIRRNVLEYIYLLVNQHHRCVYVTWDVSHLTPWRSLSGKW